ncbi:MAG: thioredoxin family protein [Candidatus Zixiibacteriota bacterium]
MSFGANINNGNFAELTCANKVLVVDFWAPWCKNCPQVEKILQDVEKSSAGHIGFANSNVEEDGMLASKFGVRSLPSVLIFNDGQVVSQLSGNFSKGQLQEKLNEV